MRDLTASAHVANGPLADPQDFGDLSSVDHIWEVCTALILHAGTTSSVRNTSGNRSNMETPRTASILRMSLSDFGVFFPASHFATVCWLTPRTIARWA